MDKIWSTAAQNLRASQEAQTKAVNYYQKDVEYKAGNLVYLSSKNFNTIYSCPKLEHK